MDMKKAPITRRNVWKIVSVAFIAVFLTIIAGGFINAGTGKQFEEPTGDMIDFAQSVVARDLEASGDSMDNYEVLVTNRVVGLMNRHQRGGPMMEPECPCENIQVALRNQSTGMLYIIDAESGNIIMKSRTEWFDDDDE
jgi:hypothetical protein